MKKNIYILLFVSVLIGCAEKEKYEKEVLYEYPTGIAKTEVTYKISGDKKIKYMVETYYPSGHKESESYFDEDGKRHGHWKYWFENGNLWSETEYVHGMKEGKNVAYYKNGNKRFEGQFKNDKKSGIWYFWDKKGKLVLEKNFNNPSENTESPAE